MDNIKTFTQELSDLINKYSQEGNSNTPDFILAEYLMDCLRSYNIAITARDSWYDFQPNKYLFTEVDDIELNSNKKKEQ